MPFLVDSTVLIDITQADAEWAQWSIDALAVARLDATPAINQLVYAEVSMGFAAAEDFDDVLALLQLKRLNLPWEAAFLAGKAFMDYRRRGGNRTSPLPDFYIGAHAAVAGLTLLTRDATRYRTYFPRLEIIAPN